MKLENELFHFFFYPFFIGLVLSAVTIIVCSIIFSHDYLDIKTVNNIVDLGKEYTKININSANALVSSTLLKIQLCTNELIIYYQDLAKKIISSNDKQIPDLNRKIDDDYLKCVLDLNESFNEHNPQTVYMAFWFLDLETNIDKLKPNSIEENQLIVLSNMMKNIFSTFYSTNSTMQTFYFYFESTELMMLFPLIYYYREGFISIFTNYTNNPVWCTDEKGEILTIYKMKCRGFYSDLKKAKTDIFDINYKDKENRTIFVTEFYNQAGTGIETVFNICIEFIDPFSEKLAYMCSDVNSGELNAYFDSINLKLSGYFFVHPVGFANSFYFPLNSEKALTIVENIFKREDTFFLEEKTYFSNIVQKLMSSNYVKYLNSSIYDEVFINGENSNNQTFYLNGQEFNYSLYPVILENYNGIKEHVLNIIYVYNNKLLYDEIKTKNDNISKILIELIIFIVFGSGLLYLIVLSFNTLAKYIVIPIKNAHYMLKGINIGGKNRLQYLNYLKQRQDDNAERLEKIFMNEYNKKDNDELNNKEENEKNNESKSNNNHKQNQMIEESRLIVNNDDEIEKNNTNNINDTEYGSDIYNLDNYNYKKFEEENEYINKEYKFYDFDEK